MKRTFCYWDKIKNIVNGVEHVYLQCSCGAKEECFTKRFPIPYNYEERCPHCWNPVRFKTYNPLDPL